MKGLYNQTITATISGEVLRENRTDDDGSTSFTVKLTPGTHKITITYQGNESYNPKNTTKTITINPYNTTLTAKATNTTTKNTTIEITLQETKTQNMIANAELIITLPNAESIKDKTDNKGKVIEKLDLPAGTNKITVTYKGNQTYRESETEISINVEKVTVYSKLTVLNDTVDNTVISVELVDETAEKITSPVKVILPDKSVAETMTQTPIQIQLPVGDNLINVTTAETDTYKQSDNTSTVRVYRRNVSIEAEVTQSMVEDVVVEVSVLDVTEDKPVKDARLDIIIDGTLHKKVNLNSTGENLVKLNVTPKGLHNFTFTFSQTAKYNGSSYKLSDVEVMTRPTKLSANYTNNTYMNTTLTVALTDDVDQTPIANRTLTLTTQDNMTLTNVTDDKGYARFKVDLPAGQKSVKLEFGGDGKYAASSMDYSFNIQKRNTRLEAEILNATYQATQLKASVMDDAFNSNIRDAKIILLDENGTLKAENTTDDYAILKPLLSKTNQTICIAYMGDENNNPANITMEINVEKRYTEIVYSLRNNTVGNVKLLIYVKDLTENLPIYTGYINITLSDGTLLDREMLKWYSIITADLPIEEPGDYTIVMNFEGNDDYYPSTYKLENATIRPRQVKASVEIADENPENTTLNITLKDEDTNETMANAEVNITLPNGTIITAKSDENGTIILPVDTTTGNSSIRIDAEGQESGEISVPIEIPPIEANVTVEVTQDSTGQNVLFIDSDVPLANGSIIIKDQEGNVIDKISINGSSSEITLDIPPEYKNITVEYEGDQKVEAKPVNVEVNSEVLETYMTVDEVSTMAGTTIELKAQVFDVYERTVNSGYVIFKINGMTIRDAWGDPYQADVHNSTAVLNFTVPISWRNTYYDITAVYSGFKDIYNPTRSESMLIVSRRSMNMSLTINNNTAQLKDSVTFTVKLEDNNLRVNFGQVIFKINGQTIKNKKNETIFVDVKNNTATYTFTIPESYKARNYTVTAVYIDRNYPRCEANETLTVEKTPVRLELNNSTTTDNTVHITGRILDGNGERIGIPVSVAFKINGITQKDSKNNTKYFEVRNGIIDINTSVKALHEGIYDVTVMMKNANAYASTKTNTKLTKKIL
ncbi:MAG: hypothetical protein BZ136_09100 [Methanosphaera sp. rholeuAM74]|nr:MAG: hypothetical protein BZ136_09100 [Methanosphaera sp. rholeuAM74]